MTDYISREDALNFEMEIEADPEEIQAISKGMALYGEYIKSIPAADVVERKRGMWQWRTIIDDSPPIGQYECSQCGYPEPRMEIANYCTRCGADMRGDSDV